MMAEGLRYEINGRIASLTLIQPEQFNLLTEEILQAFGEVARQLSSNADVDVLTITAEGTSCFSTGLLTPALRSSLPKPEVLKRVRLANESFDAIEALPQIVIAGLNGFVRAGAVELALACDIRIAGDHVTLSSPEAKWGGFAGAGAPVRLPRIVGMGRALELLCTGREVGAVEMERIGLVDRLVAQEAVHATLSEMAQTIAGNGPLATKGAKRIARMREESGFVAARKLSDELRAALEWTKDVDEGMAAVREGRKPRFTGT
jgi:enoyl-CoA hydratase/carnithine racemase